MRLSKGQVGWDEHKKILKVIDKLDEKTGKRSMIQSIEVMSIEVISNIIKS
jgi:hypothetical protein